MEDARSCRPGEGTDQAHHVVESLWCRLFDVTKEPPQFRLLLRLGHRESLFGGLGTFLASEREKRLLLDGTIDFRLCVLRTQLVQFNAHLPPVEPCCDTKLEVCDELPEGMLLFRVVDDGLLELLRPWVAPATLGFLGRFALRRWNLLLCAKQ